MKREEFMERLAQLLSDLSEEERQEAIAFYASYFDDAGEDNEASIIQELESPEKVAATIKEGLVGNYGVEEETIKHPPVVSLEKESAKKEQENTWNAENTYTQGATYGAYGNAPAGDGGRIVLIVILLALTSPIWFSAVCGIFSVLVGIVITIAVLVFAGFVVGIACMSVGIGQAAVGAAAEAVALFGIGLLGIAAGLGCLVLLVLICGKFLPWAVCAIINGIQNLFHLTRKEKVA
ncbi:MAG: DUF1700 domain-containing protein [Lachnospiraceae bacterium]